VTRVIPFQRRLAAGFLILLATAAAGRGFYFKTYRLGAVSTGMSEEDVTSALGNPLSVQNLGTMQVWRFLAPEGGGYTKKKEYFLVWFRDGQVVKWGKTEEEKVPVPSTT
jgi:hypothetical protein